MTKLWRSGVILSAAGFAAGLVNYASQGILGRLLGKAEFGYVTSTLGFIGLLSLPLVIGTWAVTHYIAHFRASGDEARLAGTIAGCRKFLFRLTVAGSILAAVLLKPLSDFFHFPRSSLMLVALLCVLAALWGAFVNALCQGLGWFNRLALISLGTAALRFCFGLGMAWKFPVAEVGVLATGVALLSNLILLYWRKELKSKEEAISPYNREFAQYLAVGAACLTGVYCFTQGDVLAAQRNFTGTDDLGLYAGAGLLGRALPMVAGPVLIVLFTSRSGDRTGNTLREQLKLLGLCAAGLAVGATVLVVFREFWVRMMFGEATPKSAAMLSRLTVTMAFVSLTQALGMWALASRWFKMALFYGVCGVAYWLILLRWGKSPEELLRLMPVAAGVAFGLLLIAWVVTMRSARSKELEHA
jgi:O-antigen/teichoic acid export membrane protein